MASSIDPTLNGGTTTGSQVSKSDLQTALQAAKDEIEALQGGTGFTLTATDGNILVGDGTDFVSEGGATARTSLGLAIGTDVQAFHQNLADISGLAVTDGNIVVGDGNNFVAESGATARTSLGLGTAATQNTGTSGTNVPLLDGNNTWSGTATFQGVVSFSEVTVSLTNTDADATRNPRLELYRNSASPAATDEMGSVDFQGENDADAKTFYASIRGGINDASSGAEYGQVHIYAIVNGSDTGIMRVGDGVQVGNPTGGFKGATTINAEAVYDDNSLLTDYVFDAEIDGDIDTGKWDGQVPDRPDGTERIHRPARDFKRNMDELEPAQYVAKAESARKLPAISRIPEGEESVGALIQALMETCEVQAVHIKKLEARITQLENVT